MTATVEKAINAVSGLSDEQAEKVYISNGYEG